MKKRYFMTVTLEMSDYVVAENEQQAFMILSDAAMRGGSWTYEVDDDVEEVEDDEDEEY